MAAEQETAVGDSTPLESIIFKETETFSNPVFGTRS